MSTHTAHTWVPDDQSFGARLALVRHAMGWNQKEAALACSISQSSWRSWEQGRKPHDLLEVAERIAVRTGVDSIWLMTGRTMKNSPGPGVNQDRGVRLPRLDSNQQPSDTRLWKVAA